MSQKRLTTWQKATALVPLALLSGAWTASLVGPTTATAATKHEQSLPDGTTIPDQAIEAPASVSRPGEIAPAVPDGAARSVISSSSTNGIPAAALAAYQRAAEVINSADPGCHVSWELIAAIGRVESDHGRYGGNVLDADGKSVPGIFGIPLDGSNGTARITDTDAAQYDDDPVYDRAVGPMQFIPSTWSVVGVDGDGDDVRDPQDIDDAALATAVYLCSGTEDLSTLGGQRSAVYRYNHSSDYVDLVLSIMHAYQGGDYAAVPNGTAAPTVLAPAPAASAGRGEHNTRPDRQRDKGDRGQATTGGSRSGGGSTGSDGGAASPGKSGGSGGTTDPGAPALPGDGDGAKDPVKDVTDKVKDTVEDTTETVKETVVDVSTATQMCTAALQAEYGEAPQQAVTSCVNQLVGKTLSDAQASLGGIVAGLGDLVDSLVGGVLGGGLLD